MKLDDITRMLRPLSVRLANLVSRVVIKRVDDAKAVQELQVEALADEVIDEVERFQNYGFTSVPLEGAEGVMLCVGGRREHSYCLGVEDRRYRMKSLQPGEVAIYTDQGDSIVIKRGGNIEVTASTKLKIAAPLVEITGDLNVSGTVTATTDVVGGGKHLATHVHSATLSLVGTTAAPGAPLAGTAAGNTGAPT